VKYLTQGLEVFQKGIARDILCKFFSQSRNRDVDSVLSSHSRSLRKTIIELVGAIRVYIPLNTVKVQS